jgi:transposase
VPRREPDPPPPEPTEIERLRRENDQLREDLRRSEAERQRLRRENDKLRDELDAARRAVYRQAAPFSRGTRVRHPRRPGRKPGAAYGVHATRQPPPRIDETYDAPLPPTCPHCAGPMRVERIAMQYHEDLPVQFPLVRAFQVQIGHCTQCQRRVQGRHPLQTSDALGGAAAQLGPQAIAFAALLNKRCGLSYGKIAALLRDRFSLTVTTGGLVQAVQRVARVAQPTYDHLAATVRASPVVTMDETSWRVDADLQWLWAAATPLTTVYAIQPGRGLAQAAAMIGQDYSGVLVRDGWQSYRQFTQALHQTCLAHLLRTCRRLLLDYPDQPFVHEVKRILQAALHTRTQYQQGAISAHGLAVARGHYLQRLGQRLARTPSRRLAVRRFQGHLVREYDAIFSFLFDPTLDATNWRAEQALRPAVVTRKMCGGGNRTARGAQSQQILTTLLRTADQRGLDATALIASLLTTTRPTVPLALRTVPAIH